MCGRFAFFLPPEEVLAFFRCTAPVGMTPTYNAAPSQTLPVMVGRDGKRVMEMMRWGLVPSWSKDGKPGFSTNNARAEGLTDKPAFREPFRSRRCLIPADAFYEWAEQGPKQAYCVRRSTGEPFAMAGLWDRWHGPDGSSLDSFTIIVTAANAVMGRFHHRMPAILPPSWWNAWLSPTTPPADLTAMLAPCPDDVMTAYPIGDRVNTVRNNDPGLLEAQDPTAPPSNGQFRLDL